MHLASGHTTHERPCTGVNNTLSAWAMRRAAGCKDLAPPPPATLTLPPLRSKPDTHDPRRSPRLHQHWHTAAAPPLAAEHEAAAAVATRTPPPPPPPPLPTLHSAGRPRASQPRFRHTARRAAWELHRCR